MSGRRLPVDQVAGTAAGPAGREAARRRLGAGWAGTVPAEGSPPEVPPPPEVPLLPPASPLVATATRSESSATCACDSGTAAWVAADGTGPAGSECIEASIRSTGTSTEVAAPAARLPRRRGARFAAGSTGVPSPVPADPDASVAATRAAVTGGSGSEDCRSEDCRSEDCGSKDCGSKDCGSGGSGSDDCGSECCGSEGSGSTNVASGPGRAGASSALDGAPAGRPAARRPRRRPLVVAGAASGTTEDSVPSKLPAAGAAAGIPAGAPAGEVASLRACRLDWASSAASTAVTASEASRDIGALNEASPARSDLRPLDRLLRPEAAGASGSSSERRSADWTCGTSVPSPFRPEPLSLSSLGCLFAPWPISPWPPSLWPLSP